MAVKVLASFPNSRIKPRPATREALPETYIAPSTADAPATVLPDGGVVTPNGNVQVALYDDNRTYMYLRNRNTDANDILLFGYTDFGPEFVLGVRQDGINYLKPDEGYDIESKETVFMRSRTGNRIEVQTETGIG